jgi:quinol monooxygenase YgiN
MNQQTAIYRHVVVFKFQSEATEEQIQDIVNEFSELPKQIGGIVGFEHGQNVSPEGLDQGFTHVFMVSFRDKSDFEAYLPHPAHKAFVEKLLPILDQPFVVDFIPTS